MCRRHMHSLVQLDKHMPGVPQARIPECAEFVVNRLAYLLPVDLLLAGLPVGELQRYLDDPMSDPCVRRGEQTLSTTVEHVKLLRNRLEATTQEQIAELQSYFVLTADNLSRQVEDEGEATGRGNDKRKEDEAGQHDLEGIFSAKIDEFDRNLIAKTAEMEERMGTLVDARFGALERRLDMVLGKAPEQGDT